VILRYFIVRNVYIFFRFLNKINLVEEFPQVEGIIVDTREGPIPLYNPASWRHSINVIATGRVK
jgi:hypothetical protein